VEAYASNGGPADVLASNTLPVRRVSVRAQGTTQVGPEMIEMNGKLMVSSSGAVRKLYAYDQTLKRFDKLGDTSGSAAGLSTAPPVRQAASAWVQTELAWR
jgi:hypothetical protein